MEYLGSSDYHQPISYLVPRLRCNLSVKRVLPDSSEGARDEAEKSKMIIAVITVEPAFHAFVSQEGMRSRLKGRTSHTFNRMLRDSVVPV